MAFLYNFTADEIGFDREKIFNVHLYDHVVFATCNSVA